VITVRIGITGSWSSAADDHQMLGRHRRIQPFGHGLRVSLAPSADEQDAKGKRTA
jgi:hypothetical protein